MAYSRPAFLRFSLLYVILSEYFLHLLMPALNVHRLLQQSFARSFGLYWYHLLLQLPLQSSC